MWGGQAWVGMGSGEGIGMGSGEAGYRPAAGCGGAVFLRIT